MSCSSHRSSRQRHRNSRRKGAKGLSAGDRSQPREPPAGSYLGRRSVSDGGAVMRGPLVSDLMSRPVVAAGPGTSFKELVALLAEHAIAAIPVVDEHRRPIGVVGEADLLARHGRDARRERGLGRLRVWTKAQGLTARELM